MQTECPGVLDLLRERRNRRGTRYGIGSGPPDRFDAVPDGRRLISWRAVCRADAPTSWDHHFRCRIGCRRSVRLSISRSPGQAGQIPLPRATRRHACHLAGEFGRNAVSAREVQAAPQNNKRLPNLKAGGGALRWTGLRLDSRRDRPSSLSRTSSTFTTGTQRFCTCWVSTTNG